MEGEWCGCTEDVLLDAPLDPGPSRVESVTIFSGFKESLEGDVVDGAFDVSTMNEDSIVGSIFV